MDGCPVVFLHLVELIDAADSHISQHQSTGLKGKLLGIRIDHDGCSETDSGTSLSRCVNCPWSKERDVLEELRFGNTWVTDEGDVDFTSDFEVVMGLFGHSAGHEQQQRFFD